MVGKADRVPGPESLDSWLIAAVDMKPKMWRTSSLLERDHGVVHEIALTLQWSGRLGLLISNKQNVCGRAVCQNLREVAALMGKYEDTKT